MYLTIYKKLLSLKKQGDRFKWYNETGIVAGRAEDFFSSVKNLLLSVNKALQNSGQKTMNLCHDPFSIKRRFSSRELNLYRLVLTWASPGLIIKQNPLNFDIVSFSTCDISGHNINNNVNNNSNKSKNSNKDLNNYLNNNSNNNSGKYFEENSDDNSGNDLEENENYVDLDYLMANLLPNYNKVSIDEENRRERLSIPWLKSTKGKLVENFCNFCAIFKTILRYYA